MNFNEEAQTVRGNGSSPISLVLPTPLAPKMTFTRSNAAVNAGTPCVGISVIEISGRDDDIRLVNLLVICSEGTQTVAQISNAANSLLFNNDGYYYKEY